MCVRERDREREREQVSSEQERKDPQVLRCTGERRSWWPRQSLLQAARSPQQQGGGTCRRQRPGRTANQTPTLTQTALPYTPRCAQNRQGFENEGKPAAARMAVWKTCPKTQRDA